MAETAGVRTRAACLAMSYERLWERLLEFLNGWTVAAEVEPGRIEVTVQNPEGSAKAVEILMTHGQWDEL